jgi:hypothetical protein
MEAIFLVETDDKTTMKFSSSSVQMRLFHLFLILFVDTHFDLYNIFTLNEIWKQIKYQPNCRHQISQKLLFNVFLLTFIFYFN